MDSQDPAGPAPTFFPLSCWGISLKAQPPTGKQNLRGHKEQSTGTSRAPWDQGDREAGSKYKPTGPNGGF